jgi:hypothetical protein
MWACACSWRTFWGIERGKDNFTGETRRHCAASPQAISRQLSAFGCWCLAVGVWLLALRLTPDGARKIVAARGLRSARGSVFPWGLRAQRRQSSRRNTARLRRKRPATAISRQLSTVGVRLGPAGLRRAELPNRRSPQESWCLVIPFRACVDRHSHPRAAARNCGGR